MSDLGSKYEALILCPNTDAGYQALLERIAEGWEVVCQWVDHRKEVAGRDILGSPIDFRILPITHIAMRRACPTESGAADPDRQETDD